MSQVAQASGATRSNHGPLQAGERRSASALSRQLHSANGKAGAPPKTLGHLHTIGREDGEWVWVKVPK